MIEIAPARPEDLPAITAMYNDAILNSAATFVITPWTESDATAWFQSHDEQHPVLVARSDGEVVGWGALNVFVARCAYASTVENSVYVKAEWRGQGVGTQLLQRLIERATELGHHSIVARIADHSTPSVTLHRALGFHIVGELREAGYKFDRWIDVTLMQRMLQP
jgi:L-amino acid N-acyltransferase YncA